MSTTARKLTAIEIHILKPFLKGPIHHGRLRAVVVKLSDLKAKGYLEKVFVNPSPGQTIKNYYAITEQGREALNHAAGK